MRCSIVCGDLPEPYAKKLAMARGSDLRGMSSDANRLRISLANKNASFTDAVYNGLIPTGSRANNNFCSFAL